MKKALYIFTIFLTLISVSCLSAEQTEGPADITVRVLIIDDRGALALALKGRYTICALNSDRVLMSGPFLSSIVTGSKNGIIIADKEMKVRGIKISVARDSNIYVDNRRFRGRIDILLKDNGRLMVINYIKLDDYLYGVLYYEVSHRWPMEALKVQAIAARTFALYQARQNGLQPYDLRSDVYSQMYGGRTSEKWATTRAVNLTKGKVLALNSYLIPSYYHATCGGHTEDASNLWNINLPCLKGVACDFCKSSPHYKWTKEISPIALEDKLKDGGYKIGKVVSVVVLSKNGSGRVDKLEIKDDAGASVVLTGKDFRQLMGPNELRSTKFEASLKWNNLVLNGFGWGHGVGMCQWGAFGQAKAGKKADEILGYYYPGAEVTTIGALKR